MKVRVLAVAAILGCLAGGAAYAEQIRVAHLGAGADRGPSPLKWSTPDYPEGPQHNRVAGACVAMFDLAPDGSATNICTKCVADRPADAPSFDKEFRRALMHSTFPRAGSDPAPRTRLSIANQWSVPGRPAPQALTAADALAACAAPIDVAAGPGKPNALDSACQVDRSADGAVVRASCPAGNPTQDAVRESLVKGFGLTLIPGGPLTVEPNGPNAVYRFAVDSGKRPLTPPPNFPSAAAQAGYAAACAARFDLTADGGTTNVCVACDATGAREAFEDSVRKAVSRWIYPSAKAAASQRKDIRVQLPFQRSGGAAAPATPASACPTPSSAH
jgi:hypothetical protein